MPEAVAFAFVPPAIPGIGSGGGFSLLAAGPQRGLASSSSNANLQKFLEAARKRPELATVNSPFRAAVPQVFADVDREKAAEAGRAGGRRRTRRCRRSSAAST